VDFEEKAAVECGDFLPTSDFLYDSSRAWTGGPPVVFVTFARFNFGARGNAKL